MNYEIKTSFENFPVNLGQAYIGSTPFDLDTQPLDKSILGELSGFYALIQEVGTKLVMAVDRARSIPLFYAVENGALFVSDSFYWIEQQLSGFESCDVGQSEFLLAGYVTGDNTLDKKIKQLEAGQYVEICTHSGQVSKEDYFLFNHQEPSEYAEAELKQAFYGAVDSVFERLVEHANGRQIVLPLSGGFDSRLIASTLKRLNYNNVVCFSYGRKNNKEAQLSKKIADALGFKWFFVEYEDSKWQAWFECEGKQFQNMAANGSSLPHIQDWLAVKELKEKKLIETSAICVPGHSGDFVAGSHIPSMTYEKPQFSKRDLIKQVLHDHFSNLPKEEVPVLHKVVERLETQLPSDEKFDPVTFANSYELWDWRERQCKYIINSVRVYDFFGVSWWLPLWDKEFVEFWCTVPLILRKERFWYNQLVAEQFNGITEDSESVGDKNSADFSLSRRLAHTFYQYLPTIAKRKIYEKKLRNDFDTHFLAFGGLLTLSQKNSLARYGYNFIGVYSLLFIEKRWGKRE